MTVFEVEYELRGELGNELYRWLMEHGKRDFALMLKFRYQEWRSWYDIATRMSMSWSMAEEIDKSLLKLAKDYFETEHPELSYINLDNDNYNFIIRNGNLHIEPIAADSAEPAESVKQGTPGKPATHVEPAKFVESDIDESTLTVGDAVRTLRYYQNGNMGR